MKILKVFLRTQVALAIWVLLAVVFFWVLHGSLKIGLFYGLMTLLAGNVVHLINFIIEKK